MATTRLKKLSKKLSENVGMTMEKAMTSPEVGYSPSYARSARIKKTKGWNELLEDIFPDAEIAAKHKALLNAQSIDKAPFHYKIKDEEIKALIEGEGFRFIGTKRFMTNAIVYFAVPDNLVQDKALDKVYKLKAKYAPERSLVGHFNINDEKKQKVRRILQDAFGGDAN